MEVGVPVQTNKPLYKRTDLPEETEPLTLMVFEGGKFINHHHIKIPPQAIFLVILHQPFDRLTVDDIHQRRMVQCPNPCLYVPNDDGNGKELQMFPLFNFCRPGVPRNSKWCYYQHLAHVKGIQHQVIDR